METKVLKNIEKTRDTQPNNGVHKGKKEDDEMYTPLDLIYKELIYWASRGKFQGKKIICPCDWDIVKDSNIYSITIDYNELGIDVKGNAVPKVSYDLWEDESEPVKIDLPEDQVDEFLKHKLTCNFLRTLTQNARSWGIKSVSASGYNPALGKGISFEDVDYSKYDICITNPPFSLYPTFMKTIVGNIDFIVLAPFMNRCSPSVGQRLMLGECYLGSTEAKEIQFIRPDKYAKDKKYDGMVCCDWITSFSDAQDERNEENACKDFGIDYEQYKDQFLTMPYMFMKEGKNPIRAASKSFPKNYGGWIFANIRLLGKLDLRKYDWYITQATKYFHTNKEANPFDDEKIKASGKSIYYLSENKTAFSGIVFRLKPEYRTHNNG